ncbi:hypothetical protein C474_00250 [Halogeometricum pallidum JCM 14848]|uniref:Uncharacterized protein n=1 Tax=Halogeometricum pallidum JCM 14848 TaxID=1227487 RepID=M0DHU4_HALPD|nr:hypothetical protein C474_00250 [Halogeometricum pallidum JCM 14848]
MAGCSGGSEEAAGGDTPVENPGDDGGETTATAAATETETETATSTEAPGKAEVVIASREVRTEETDYGTVDAYAVFELVNEGDAPSGPINVELRFYDGSDTILSTRPATARTLGPGETWRGFKKYLDTEGQDVASVRIEAEFASSLTVMEDVEVVESSISREEDSSYLTSTGVLQNNTGGELGYIEAISKFYIEEKVIVGAEYTNELNIPAGERWRFENMFDTSFAPEITNVEILPGDNNL